MSIASDAKAVYERDLKVVLEPAHRDQFVAIEPASRSYYVADTFVDAALAAKKAHPDRQSFVIRIGHDAAFHIGAGPT